jgi:hypothetical protein
MMIFYPRKGKAKKEQDASEETGASVNPYHHEENVMDGSEFLDDAIRMKEQPLEEPPIREDQ